MQWVVNDKVIDLIKINTKKNLADIMTKTILVEKFRSSRFSKGKVANGLLRGSHVKSQKGEESKANETKANYYGETQ